MDYRKKAEEIVKNLNETQPLVADEVYHALKKESYKMDALAFISGNYDYDFTESDFSEEENDIADAIAERLVYEGDFDTNISFWDNFKNIYDEITTADIEPDAVLA